MKKNVFLLLIVCAVFNFMSFMSFATSFDYALPVPDATIDYDKVDYKKAKYHYSGDNLVY